ncbi:hypothetical protein [Nocardia rhizosphaerae]|uniref:Sigma-70-like protein n=1 Tax=Nocardia rhizosphaerae TaxID=1691571 RepID=A0ABV8LF83_9NOCA
MADSSLTGYGVEPSEVDAILDNLVSDDPAEDSWTRYTYLSSRQQLFTAVVDAIAAKRRQAVADIYAEQGDERSYARVATLLGLHRARVQQMIEQHRAEAQ